MPDPRFAYYDHPWPLPEGPEPALVESGRLTRAGAQAEARKMYGDLGTISSDDRLPRLVWCVGRFGITAGRGRTWEEALAHAQRRKRKLDEKVLAEMHRAQEILKLEVQDV